LRAALRSGGTVACFPTLRRSMECRLQFLFISLGKRYCVGFLGNLKYGSLTPEIEI
jgi:hypothetical protein